MPTPSPEPRRPLVFAHRGGAALAPENTLPAFESGLFWGADGLELDVHLSRDGVVVVHHDATLDRTTNASGPVAARTAADLAAVDAGYRFQRNGDFPYRGSGIGIPSLDDVLASCPDVPVIVEIKVDTPDLARATVDTVTRAGALDRVILGSFHREVLDEARAYAPRVRTGAAMDDVRGEVARRPGSGHARAFDMYQVPETYRGVRVLSPEFVARAHEADVPVYVWTIDREEDIRRLLDWGVDGIISDRPDVAVGAVGAWWHARRDARR